jgi:ABC-type proline/glycine betaine transport system permease subunit
MLLQTGHVDRWDVFIAVPAAIGTGGLLLFSALGYARSAKKLPSDVVRFAATTAIVAGFFIGIFYFFAPRFLGIFKPVLRLIGISG